ncbi:FAD/NAD(P)-binding protein [Microbacterium sp. NPDC055665]
MTWEYRMRVAIVGVGAGGLATALSMSERGPDSLDLTLFDPLFKDPHQSARGLAYQADHCEPLLNAPASMMSVREEDEGDFVRWIRRSSAHADEFVSRTVFGEYLSESLDSLRRQWVARSGTLHCVPSEATSISRTDGERFSVSTKTARFDSFDAVYLCIGWSKDGASADGEITPYPLDELILRAMDASHVGIVGTGLTAVDVARALLSNGFRGRITLASRRGLLPGSRVSECLVPTVLTRATLADLESLDLRTLLHFVELEAQAQCISLEAPRRFLNGDVTPQESLRGRADPERWRALFVTLCDEVMADAWHLMDDESRRVFRRWLHPYFQSWCNPMPPPTAAMLATAMDAGQLVARGGLRRAEDHRLVFGNGEYQDVDLTVSARLSSADSIADMKSLLVQSLIDGELAVRHDFGGLRVQYGTWRIMTPDGAHVPIYAIGSLAQGARYYVSALDSIVRTVPEAVEDAVRTFDDEAWRTPSMPSHSEK